MEIKVRSYPNYVRASIKIDYYSTEITLWLNALQNCQVATLSGIEDVLDECDDKEVLAIIRKLVFGRINIFVIDITRALVGRVEKIFGKNILTNTPYHSTNGNDRNMLMIKSAYL